MKRKSRELYTYIIGGKYRGKKIALPSPDVTRSSKSRLRESVFNTLQFDIVGSNFIEMFGGSGSVGLEAISRGAKKAWFIELDRDSFNILTANSAALDPARCDLRYGDAFEVLPEILRELRERGEKCYLYIDPPFSIREGSSDIYEKVLETIGMIDPDVIISIIVEHMSREAMPQRVGPFEKFKEKKFGKSSLSYYKS
ncbi:16S rRNA (guanine(966)-N(2))-methyltransferase [Hydrogenimonas sp.]|nr:16S rRNA (guanine(966)-N(2))-methyltransferase [Hydrogenimonas sp.]